MLTISGIVLYTRIGLNKEERGKKREIDVDINLDTDDSIDLKEVYELIRNKVEGSTYRLIEEVAESLISIVVKKYKPKELIINVRKPNPPIGGKVEYIGCELTYSKSIRTSLDLLP